MTISKIIFIKHPLTALALGLTVVLGASFISHVIAVTTVPADEGLHVEGSVGIDKNLTVAGAIAGLESPTGEKLLNVDGNFKVSGGMPMPRNEKLIINSNGLNSIIVAAHKLTLFDDNDLAIVMSGINFTINNALGESLNGQETGHSASTWRGIWAISDGTNVKGVLAGSFGADSEPNLSGSAFEGYIYKKLLGATKGNSFYQTNNYVHTTRTNVGGSTEGAVQTITFNQIMPGNNMAIGIVNIFMGSYGTPINMYMTYGPFQQRILISHAGAGVGGYSRYELLPRPDNTVLFEPQGRVHWDVSLLGWKYIGLGF